MVDIIGDEVIEGLSEHIHKDLMAALGYALTQLSPHATLEALVQNCARDTGVDQNFLRACFTDSRSEYFNALLRKKTP